MKGTLFGGSILRCEAEILEKGIYRLLEDGASQKCQG